MWETPEPVYFESGIGYPLLLDGELGTKHLADPWAMFAGVGMVAVCDSRPLTHIDMISREKLTLCTQCLRKASQPRTIGT